MTVLSTRAYTVKLVLFGNATPYFEYSLNTAWNGGALRRNILAFRRAEFRPRVLRDVADVDPSTMLLGRHLPVPLELAPTGFTRVASPGGELDAARAAGRMNLAFTLSTMATRSIEEVGPPPAGRSAWVHPAATGRPRDAAGRAAPPWVDLGPGQG